jgi:hypothetical protein
LRRIRVNGNEVGLDVYVANVAAIGVQEREDGTANDGALTVPSVVPDWLPNPDNWQNSVRQFLFSLPVALIATERPFPASRPPARQSAIDLAFEFQRLLDEGVVNSRADIARRYAISRARVAQVLNVLRLPQPVISALLRSSGCQSSRCTERKLRRILVLPSPEAQIAAFERLRDRDAWAKTRSPCRQWLPSPPYERRAA